MPKHQKDGTGSFRCRAQGRFEYRVYNGIDSSGKPLRVSFYGNTQKICLEKYKAWIENDRERNIESVRTVGEWATKWLEVYKDTNAGIAYGTYRNYKMYVERHINPIIGRLKFEQVRPAHIKQLFANARNQHGNPLSDSARHHLYITLKGIFDSAVENRFCKESPVVPPARQDLAEQMKIQVFAPEHIAALLKSDALYSEYVKLLLYTGLRMGEMLALKWCDVDFNAGIITVSRSLARAKDGGFEEKTPKSKKTRYIGITPALETLLHSLPINGFYVLSNFGCPVTPHQFERRYKTAVVAAGVAYLSPHKCRHTYATYLIKGGAELRAVQSMLGHSKSEVTELYTHVDTSDILRNVKKLGY